MYMWNKTFVTERWKDSNHQSLSDNKWLINVTRPPATCSHSTKQLTNGRTHKLSFLQL